MPHSDFIRGKGAVTQAIKYRRVRRYRLALVQLRVNVLSSGKSREMLWNTNGSRVFPHFRAHEANYSFRKHDWID